MVQGSSRNFASATLSSVDICRARASATWSPTVVPSRTLPRRGMLPPANSSASISVVLPDRYGPTRATQRWPAALGIGISIYPVAAIATRVARLALCGADGGERADRRQSESGGGAQPLADQSARALVGAPLAVVSAKAGTYFQSLRGLRGGSRLSPGRRMDELL